VIRGNKVCRASASGRPLCETGTRLSGVAIRHLWSFACVMNSFEPCYVPSAGGLLALAAPRHARGLALAGRHQHHRQPQLHPRPRKRIDTGVVRWRHCAQQMLRRQACSPRCCAGRPQRTSGWPRFTLGAFAPVAVSSFEFGTWSPAEGSVASCGRNCLTNDSTMSAWALSFDALRGSRVGS
jgi:hypothetical protein